MSTQFETNFYFKTIPKFGNKFFFKTKNNFRTESINMETKKAFLFFKFTKKFSPNKTITK